MVNTTNYRNGVFSIFVLVAAMCFAEEKKEEKKKPEPPSVTVVMPLGITTGVTNKIKIRGLNLTNVTELRFTDTNCHAEIAIKSKGKADFPKELEAVKVGDTQIELELRLAETTAPGTNTFTLISPDGESKPHPLLVFEPGSLVAEKEPNGGFREAQEIKFDKRVQGVIQEAKDVDVFRFSGKARQKITAEVFAARLGSPLDSVLTLYDQHGHIIATNDDSDSGSDSLLKAELPADGEYLISLIDAHDRGSAAHVYQLLVTLDNP